MLRHLLRGRTIGAGVVDVGLASLATFCSGVFATRYFDPIALGAYALGFRAFVFANIVPSQLIFLPAEIAAMRVGQASRARLLGPTLRVGVPVALASAALATLWPLAWPGPTLHASITPLNVTVAICVLVSPVQDYIRRALHVSGASWGAAAVSSTQLGVVLTAIVAALAWRADGVRWWVPFGSLALANVVSTGVGTVLLRRRLAGSPPIVPPTPRELMHSGRWLLVTGLLSAAATFGGAAVLTRVSSPASLGYVEAARVVAQPLLVLAIGLAAVLGPKSVEAAQLQQAERARTVANRVNGFIMALGLVYLVLAGIPWPGNPVIRLIPTAYVVHGLTALMIVAQVSVAVCLPERNELLGAGRGRFLAGAEVGLSGIRFAIAFLGGYIGAAALPAGTLVQGVVRWTLFRRRLRALYASTASAGERPRTAESGRPNPPSQPVDD